MAPGIPWRTSDAVAIAGERVVAVGADARRLADATSATVTDLHGAVVAPALADGHAHPLLGGLESFGPAVRGAPDLDATLQAVADWRAAHPDAGWIVGGSYDATHAEGGRFDARWLDGVTGDVPTVLRAWDYHTIWVNSAALRRAGIDEHTPDPPGGRILRRPDGTPLGTLVESAANDFMRSVVPPFSDDRRVAAISAATQTYAAQGIAWVQDAWVEPPDLESYLAAANRGELHVRVNLALLADPSRWRDDLPGLLESRNRVRRLGHRRLSAETVKIFVDGVVENHTAAMLEPYTDRPDELGLLNWSPPELEAAVRAFDAEGFQVHLHAIGDRANRLALDALARARAENGPPRRPHVIAHASIVHPDDIARFAELGVIANLQPFWAQPDRVMRELTIPHIGSSRERWQYRIRAIRDAGATVAFGSDWPVSTLDWRAAMATALTRQGPGAAPDEVLSAEERIDATAAFAAYTTGAARQAGAPDRGTLEPGSTADLMVLSADPLTTAPAALRDVQVLETWVAGTRVFAR